jgi:hypothetical protein
METMHAYGRQSKSLPKFLHQALRQRRTHESRRRPSSVKSSVFVIRLPSATGSQQQGHSASTEYDGQKQVGSSSSAASSVPTFTILTLSRFSSISCHGNSNTVDMAGRRSAPKSSYVPPHNPCTLPGGQTGWMACWKRPWGLDQPPPYQFEIRILRCGAVKVRDPSAR